MKLNHEELVISGVSGRFPQSENIEELSSNLFKGVDLVTGEITEAFYSVGSLKILIKIHFDPLDE